MLRTSTFEDGAGESLSNAEVVCIFLLKNCSPPTHTEIDIVSVYLTYRYNTYVSILHLNHQVKSSTKYKITSKSIHKKIIITKKLLNQFLSK